MAADAPTGGLLGCGNPILDMTATVGEKTLARYELETGAVILAEERHVGVFDEVRNDERSEYLAGGAAQNALRVCAWMLSGRKKSERPACGFVGCVGDDAAGRRLSSMCVDAGVRANYLVDPELPTGRCAALINRGDGERTLVAHLAAATNYDAAHLDTGLSQQLVEEARCYYCAGFFLTHAGGRASVAKLGAHCAASAAAGRPKVLALNLGAVFVCRHFPRAVADALPHVDLLLGSEREVRALGEARRLTATDGGDLAAVAVALAALPKATGARGRAVVVTRAHEDTICVVDGTVRTYAVTPLARQSVVDLTGAGDAFAGGFLSQLLLGKPIADCVHAAHWAARVVIQRQGCSLPDQCDYA